jgi:hypothetical protein
VAGEYPPARQPTRIRRCSIVGRAAEYVKSGEKRSGRCILLSALFVVLANLVVDLLCPPRPAHGSAVAPSAPIRNPAGWARHSIRIASVPAR